METKPKFFFYCEWQSPSCYNCCTFSCFCLFSPAPTHYFFGHRADLNTLNRLSSFLLFSLTTTVHSQTQPLSRVLLLQRPSQNSAKLSQPCYMKPSNHLPYLTTSIYTYLKWSCLFPCWWSRWDIDLNTTEIVLFMLNSHPAQSRHSRSVFQSQGVCYLEGIQETIYPNTLMLQMKTFLMIKWHSKGQW